MCGKPLPAAFSMKPFVILPPNPFPCLVQSLRNSAWFPCPSLTVGKLGHRPTSLISKSQVPVRQCIFPV